MSANIEEDFLFVTELATPLDQPVFVEPVLQIIVHHDGWQNMHVMSAESFDLNRAIILYGLRTRLGEKEIIRGHGRDIFFYQLFLVFLVL